MSEVSQGPGWWIASDGKWYPPELHPDAPPRQAPPPPAPQYQQPPQPQYQQPARPFVDPWVAQAQAQAQAQAPAAGLAAAAAPPGLAGAQAATAVGGGNWSAGAGAGGAGAKRRKPSKPVLLGITAAVVVLAIGGVLFAVLGGSSTSMATPAGTVDAVVADFQGNNLPAVCGLLVTSAQPACRAEMVFASAVRFTTTGLEVGKVSQEGAQALVVVTGTLCVDESTNGTVVPQCQTNNDPNAALDHGQTFAQAFEALSHGSSSSSPGFVFPLIEQNGKWYLDAAP